MSEEQQGAETAAGAKAAADKRAAAARIAQQAAKDQAEAAAAAAAGVHVNSVPGPELGPVVDAPPCEECARNTAMINALDQRVTALAKVVGTAVLAGAIFYAMFVFGRQQPRPAVDYGPAPVAAGQGDGQEG